MIRRTLALAGAAALAVGFTGLAGPAAADSGITQDGNVVINEVGADLDLDLSGGVEHGFIELENTGTQPVDVSGWKVTGCTTSGSFEIVIDSNTPSIPVNGNFLVGELEFEDASGTLPDQRFAAGEVLQQAAGGAQLEDNSTPQRVTLDDMAWGPGDPGVACADTPAGALPTDAQTINRGTPVLRDPTPESLN